MNWDKGGCSDLLACKLLIYMTFFHILDRLGLLLAAQLRSAAKREIARRRLQATTMTKKWSRTRASPLMREAPCP
jgi:hypothetical protein